MLKLGLKIARSECHLMFLYPGKNYQMSNDALNQKITEKYQRQFSVDHFEIKQTF